MRATLQAARCHHTVTERGQTERRATYKSSLTAASAADRLDVGREGGARRRRCRRPRQPLVPPAGRRSRTAGSRRAARSTLAGRLVAMAHRPAPRPRYRGTPPARSTPLHPQAPRWAVPLRRVPRRTSWQRAVEDGRRSVRPLLLMALGHLGARGHQGAGPVVSRSTARRVSVCWPRRGAGEGCRGGSAAAAGRAGPAPPTFCSPPPPPPPLAHMEAEPVKGRG